jgi:hypothetical protein
MIELLVILAAVTFIVVMSLRMILLYLARRPPELLCGCGHHLAYHDPGKGECSNYQPGMVKVEDGKATIEKLQCRCQQYTGPEITPQYIAPRVTERS